MSEEQEFHPAKLETLFHIGPLQYALFACSVHGQFGKAPWQPGPQVQITCTTVGQQPILTAVVVLEFGLPVIKPHLEIGGIYFQSACWKS